MTFRTVFGACIYLFVTYTTALPRIVYRTFLSPVIDPRGTQSLMHQVLDAIDIENDDQTIEANRIHQVYGDSLVFDFSPWFNKCDIVWVDACYDYEYFVSNTKNVLKLCPCKWMDRLA